ncbi:ketoacyl-ACP synthase III [Shewanella indica]|uniref:3-oxoacyl-ACP synthase III family protein n=1 Tax=Shewanella indica TaxID=768528 RepID=UPI001F1DFE02|nr:ketoacyl-ACP synthase III [Shewanella indica]MCE9793799.1 ketoacyl-ACP synthase III [Shewanella indica]
MHINQKPIKAFIAGIASYLPEKILTNDQLAKEYPDWSVDKIFEKTGIVTRHIAEQSETCSSMAINAAKKLFIESDILPSDIDYILLCTQSPDYLLPTTACIVQNELGVKTSAGALDFNLGCSGYIYGLSMAKALIESFQAKKVLLITSELYSRYINDKDKSVRTLFGDAATATLIDGKPSDENLISSFEFGTDGSGAKNLIVPHGGSKQPIIPESYIERKFESGNFRAPNNLYMNGAEILTFTLKSIPKFVNTILSKSMLTTESVDRVVFHQANKFMLDKLRRKIGFSEQQFLTSYEEYGNTVSSTIPLGLEKAIKNNEINQGHKVLLCGFGVGYSWAGCVVEW